MGKLYFGDNLDVLRKRVKDSSVDLVYLDPPFNSNASYNLLYKSPLGVGEDAQVRAFKDTWKWEEDGAEQALDELHLSNIRVFTMLQSLRSFLGESDMMAYLAMMSVRLVEMHRVLKDTGSLYLHCDQTAEHYLKIILDGIFGPENFRNAITWKRSTSHGNVGKNYGNLADCILFYTKGSKYTWNQQFARLSDNYIESKFTNVDVDGRRWQSVSLRNPSVRPNLQFAYRASNGATYQPHSNGWAVGLERLQTYDREGRLHFPSKDGGTLRLRQYLDERPGTRLQNIWDDIPAVNSQAQERLGYPTQKPIALLERLIRTSSNEDDLVLDPFCGCGTTIHASQTLGRNWIGIDVAYAAVKVIEDRLAVHFPTLKYEVSGIPTGDVAARALAKLDPYTFQQWAVAKLGGQPRGRGADRGVDGEIVFLTGARTYGRAIVSVKAGKHVNPEMVRSLHGVVEGERAEMGFFVCLDTPTDEMRRVASISGRIDVPGGRRAKIQIVTLKDLLAGPNLGLVTGLNAVQASRAADAEKRKGRKGARSDKSQLHLPPMAIAGGKGSRTEASKKTNAAAAPPPLRRRVKKG